MFIFCSAPILAKCQDIVRIVLLDDSIGISYNKISVRYEVKNDSKQAVILYNYLERLFPSPTNNLDKFCDTNNMGAGKVYFVFDSKGRWKSGQFRFDGDHSHPMTRDWVDSLFRAAAVRFQSRTLFLQPYESKVLIEEVDLSNLDLQAGSYSLQLLFYAGSKIGTFVSANQQKEDQRVNDAWIYQGCIYSNKTTLILDPSH